MKIAHQAEELTVTPGEVFELPFELSCSEKFNAEVTVELVTPPDLEGLLSAERIQLSSDQRQASLPIKSKAADSLYGDWEITLKATAMQAGKWPVVSQTSAPVRFVPPQ